MENPLVSINRSRKMKMNPGIFSELPAGAQILVGACLVAIAVFYAGPKEAHAAPDPKLVVGPGECGECHASEVTAWRKTRHFKAFRGLTRRGDALQIAKKMGIKRIKRESLCMNCHFTSKPRKKRIKPIAGISCESCHGAAKKWVDVHQNFGGKGATKKTEPPEHKKQRLMKMKAGGMIRPAEIYRLARNCFQCHTVPYEKLVNVGGHTPGSKFDLVSWLQGEVRHNYLASNGKKNAKASPERKRVLFVVGKAVELEYNLRGVAKATKKATYAVKMARRAKAAMDAFKKISGVVSAPEIQKILAASASVRLKLNNEKELLRAADIVSREAEKLGRKYDGARWAKLDPLIPKQDQYKGKPAK